MTNSLAFYISLLRRNFIRYCSGKLSEMNVTYSQLFILLFIEKKGACSPKEISAALKLDAGLLNRTLAKLAAGGFLSQVKNEKDRRGVIVSLTPSGHQVFQKSRELFYQWDRIVSSSLTDAEKKQLEDLLKKLALGSQKEMEE